MYVDGVFMPVAIGLIGLGIMGSPMAANLVKPGVDGERGAAEGTPSSIPAGSAQAAHAGLPLHRRGLARVTARGYLVDHGESAARSRFRLASGMKG